MLLHYVWLSLHTTVTTTVAHITLLYMAIILFSLTTGHYVVWVWCILQWHNHHIKFHQKPSSGPKLKIHEWRDRHLHCAKNVSPSPSSGVSVMCFIATKPIFFIFTNLLLILILLLSFFLCSSFHLHDAYLNLQFLNWSLNHHLGSFPSLSYWKPAGGNLSFLPKFMKHFFHLNIKKPMALKSDPTSLQYVGGKFKVGKRHSGWNTRETYYVIPGSSTVIEKI